MQNDEILIFDPKALEPLWELEDDEVPNLVVGLIAEFRASAHALEETITQAQARHDTKSIEISVHGLKSSARLLGGLRLEHLCSIIEEHAKHHREEAVNEGLKELSALVAATLVHLETL